MTVKELLLRAADHIENYGWVQFEPGEKGKRCCAFGAIVAVSAPEGHRYAYAGTPERELQERALSVLRRHLGKPVPTWNDTPGRTKVEVVKALRDAAEEAQ